MATVTEIFASRQTTINEKDWSQVRSYRIASDDNEEITLQSAISSLYSETSFYVVISGLMIGYRSSKIATHIGIGVWQIDVTYVGYAEAEQKDVTWSYAFSGSAGNKKIIQSKETIDASKDAPDNGRFINIDETGKPQGADIATGSHQFTIRVKIPEAELTLNEIRGLYEYENKVNETSFMGFEAGEVLSLPISGTWTPGTPWNLTLPFKVFINQRNVDVVVNGKKETIPEILGHDYYHQRYARVIEDAEKAKDRTRVVLPQVVAWYVERVYEFRDLNEMLSGGVLGRFGGGSIAENMSFTLPGSTLDGTFGDESRDA